MDSISSADARTNFSDLLAQAYYQNKKFLIQRGKRPMAILISVEEYEALQQQNANSTVNKG